MHSLLSAWWLVAGGSLFLATVIGFVAGYLSARSADRRAFRRARSGFTQLFKSVLGSLDAAREVSVLLEHSQHRWLQPEQVAQLESKRNGLLESLSRIISRTPATMTSAPSAQPATEMPKISWQSEPVDITSGLPERAALEANIALLLEAGGKAECESSLLLVRVDKLNALRARFSKPEIDRLFKRLAGVICRAVRDDDVVCRFGPDSFGILFPGMSIDTGTRQARAIRDSVRGHHFRIDDNGPEVLLTASFGYTTIRPEDNRDLVLDRAVDALAKSERMGRNQLHAHNGESLVHLAAAS